MSGRRPPTTLAWLAAAVLAAGCAGAQPSAPPPSPGPGDVVIEATALAFSPSTVRVAAGQPFAILLRNGDRTVPHNVEIRHDGRTVFKGETVPGPRDIRYALDPLAPGEYEFLCTLHPTMTGTIAVE